MSYRTCRRISFKRVSFGMCVIGAVTLFHNVGAEAQTSDGQAGASSLPLSGWLARFQSGLADLVEAVTTSEVAYGLLFTLVAVGVLVFVFRFTQWLLQRAYARLESWRGTRIPALKIQSYEVVSADRITDIVKELARVMRIGALIIALYIAIPAVLSFFPWTRDWVTYLLPYLMAPVYRLFWGIVSFLPNLVAIIVIVVATRYAVRFVGALFTEIANESIVFPGFHAEWAPPTAKLVSFLIVVFAVVLISPYLPGFGSPAFQGVSIFLGVLLSLGSTAAVANVVAGMALIYMGAFKVGDRVKIADALGDVTEKTLHVTRMRTVKNVEITIPNAMVLGSHMINFSTLAKERGLVLHTTVTIGYDVPWRRVHALLIEAAQATAHVLGEPAPFVLQSSLGDFSIAYELNVYTKEASRSLEMLSELHQNIQDKFNEAGIEIMSPRFTALRDGNEATMPSDYLPKEAPTKGFRILSREVLPKGRS
jgi:small-conductance mechanosensitive channel